MNRERYGTRDLTYSAWHRVMLRINRPMVDVDWIEYCGRCWAPLLLIETAMDIGQNGKVAIVLNKLAGNANIPALCVLYTPTGEKCSCEPQQPRPGCSHGISAFRVRDLEIGGPFEPWTPDDFARRIASVHDQHDQIFHGDGA